MQPNPHTDQFNTGTSRPMLFVSARLLGIQPPSLRIAICEIADNAPGQLPFGSMRSPSKAGNESPGNRADELSPALNCD